MVNKTVSTMVFELSVIARNVAEECIKYDVTDFDAIECMIGVEFDKYFGIDREAENNEEGD